MSNDSFHNEDQNSQIFEDKSKDEQNQSKFNQNADIQKNNENVLSNLEEDSNKIGDVVTDKNINLISKYANYSEDELRQLLNEKNESLIKLNKEKEDSKTKLNNIIKKLNDLIAKNGEILYNGEENPQSIEELERLIKIKTKDLESAKSTNCSYQKQYKFIQKKEKEQNEKEKLNIIENKIDELKIENMKYKNNINQLKKENTFQSKQLENISNEKQKNNIKGFTDDIQSISNKKHEYHLKLVINQKSLDSILKELKNLEKMNYNNDPKIKYWMDLIQADLKGTTDDIWKRVDAGESQVVKAMNEEIKKSLKDMKDSKNKENIVLPVIHDNRSSSLSSKRLKNTRFDESNKKDGFKGIFSKYTYLQNVYPSLYMTDVNAKKKGNVPVSMTNEECLKFDYDNTSEEDYKLLLAKIKEYQKTNERLEKNIKDFEKTSDKKLKDISNSILYNSQKLLELQQENDLISSEIGNLEKIYELTLEQNKIKKELKLSQRKKRKINMEHSVTSNEILQQLNKVVSDDKYEKTHKDITELNYQNDLDIDGKKIKCIFFIFIISC